MQISKCKIKRTVTLTFAICALHFAMLLNALGAAPPKRSPQGTKVSITTRLDKTALWVGDTLNYTIQTIHDRDVEFVLDNLKKENLSLVPFVVRAITIQRGEWVQNRKLLEITLLLSSYESGKTELTIPSFNLYYFKRLPGIEKKESVAEAIRVPATKVGLRSTLSGGPPKPRDSKPILATDIRRRWIPLLLGLAGMVFLAVRSVRWVWIALHGERASKRRLSRQARDKLVQDSLMRIRMIGRESPDDLLQFYTEVSQFLRQYLSQCLEIDAVGLTPDEIEAALEKAGKRGPIAPQIKAILEQCDAVRYGKDGLRLGRERQTGLLEAVERIVSSPKIGIGK